MKTKILLSGLVTVGSVLSLVGVAKADPPSGSGWDKNADVVIGGGSDTTYLVSQRLEALYNGAPGCQIDAAEAVTKGKCTDTSATPTGPADAIKGNYDHDVFVGAAPTGSGTGVDALRASGNQNNPAIDYARSSSGPSGTRINDVTYWGYARDAIAVVTFGTRTNVCLTQQDLKDIYAFPAVKTDWSQLKDCNGNFLAAGPIIPWAMNTSSGTNNTFKAYVAPSNPDTTGRKLVPVGAAAALAPFENDVKPILADPGPDLTFGTADDDENNYIWWMSYGSWATYPYTKNGKVNGTGAAINSNLVGVNGTGTPGDSNIADGTYAILRTLYQVTRNGDADCRPVGSTTVPTTTCENGTVPTVFGATSGKGGAVREFTQWLCRQTNAQQAINPITGKGYRSEIVTALNLEGFQQVPTALRTAGYACAVST